MKTFANMQDDRLAEILAEFGRLRIAIVGDFFLDKYLDVDPSLAEVSIETGKTAHQVVAVRHSPGAAGTVAGNLAALGVRTLHAVGFCGNDGEGFELVADLEQLGCSVRHLHRAADRQTPTYLKPCDRTVPGLEGEHSRYDTKNRCPTSQALQRSITDSLAAVVAEVDAVIVADQVEEAECGVVTSRVRAALADLAARNPRVIFWADSRLRIRQFRGLAIKPNQFKAIGQEKPPWGERVAPEHLLAAMAAFRGGAGARVCITRGAAGMFVSDPEPIEVPGVRVEGPIDPTGAGDSATAGAVAALAGGASLPEAALVGNLVASITIQELGTTGTARPDQVRQRLALWRRQHCC